MSDAVFPSLDSRANEPTPVCPTSPAKHPLTSCSSSPKLSLLKQVGIATLQCYLHSLQQVRTTGDLTGPCTCVHSRSACMRWDCTTPSLLTGCLAHTHRMCRGLQVKRSICNIMFLKKQLKLFPIFKRKWFLFP